MSYLVTGGAGFVGSKVAAFLLKRGEQVVIIDNFNDYYDPALKHWNIEQLGSPANLVVVDGDIRDAALVSKLFQDYHITHVAHMAAMAGVRLSVSQPALYIDVNINGTLNLLENARLHKVQQFVFASTSSVYGQTKILPFQEEDNADRPLAPYPATKRSGEILAHTYHHLYGMNIICLRFFNVYGPAGRPDMMPIMLMQAALNGNEMKLFNGGDLERDWTYIDDTVQGVVNALDRPMGYEVINLGVGRPISLKDFVGVIEELSGRTIASVSVPAPSSEPLITYCNNEKAQRLLGFAPSIQVQDGLYRTWQWFREHHTLYDQSTKK